MADRSFLAWPFFEQRHRDFAAGLEDWAKKVVTPHVDEDERDVDGTCRMLVRLLGEAGWLRACVPADHGGFAERLDVRTLCIARDILARHSGLADFAFAMQGLGTGPITLFGTPEIKAAYLPKVAQGRQIGAFALSEPEGGSDVAGLRMTARRDGNDFVLDGRKTWISNAGIADHYVVFARTGEAPGAKGLSAFVVDAGTPGLRVAERIEAIAPHPLGTLAFEGCRVPASHLLGRPGDGFKIALATLEIGRAHV